MTEFTPVGVARLAVSSVSASVDLTQQAGFQVVEKSGNIPIGVVTYRRPNVLRMTYLPTLGAGNCFYETGTPAPTATVNSKPILSGWPLQRTLRFQDNFVAAVMQNAGDTGFLQIEFGYGDPV